MCSSDLLEVTQKENTQLDQLSKSDELTGLLNRRGFTDQAEELLKKCKSERSSCMIAFIDMDNLKIVNDRFGHVPLELSAPIMLGGFVKLLVEKIYGKQNDDSGKGILFCSGLIAGEGILGIVLAILTVTGVTDKIDVSSYLPTGNITSLIVLIAVSAVVFFMSANGKKISGKKKNAK